MFSVLFHALVTLVTNIILPLLLLPLTARGPLLEAHKLPIAVQLGSGLQPVSIDLHARRYNVYREVRYTGVRNTAVLSTCMDLIQEF